MFSAQTYVERRARLRRMVGKGIIILNGNLDTAINAPENAMAFRQESSFLYYFGLDVARLVGVIDCENDCDTLYGNEVTIDEMIWTGPLPSMAEQAATVGVTRTAPLNKVADVVAEARRLGRTIHYLPQFRGMELIYMSTLLDIPAQRVNDTASHDLMAAITEMREIKTDEEIEVMERAFEVGYKMHTTAMRMCREGVIEREIIGAINGIAMQHGWGWSFYSHVTQHGEILHNFGCDYALQNGKLLLVDAGAELAGGYCSDHTRTYPVSGKFTPMQRDIYNIVLNTHDHIAEIIRPGMMYHRDIHLECYRSLAEGLRSIGLINGSAEDAVAAGAMYLFMPHGLGHGLGMDVHDCEAFGERSFDFSSIRERAEESATCIYRAAWRLQPGTVLSDEPGIYFIPALIDKSRSEGLYKGIVNYDKLEAYRNFGGIRIEDDILVTETGSRIIGDKRLPLTVEELEAVVGK